MTEKRKKTQFNQGSLSRFFFVRIFLKQGPRHKDKIIRNSTVKILLTSETLQGQNKVGKIELIDD